MTRRPFPSAFEAATIPLRCKPDKAGFSPSLGAKSLFWGIQPSLFRKLNGIRRRMDRIRSALRLIVTASLLLSVSVTSLYPRLIAAPGGGRVFGSGGGGKVCCCGTKDARCCGMACCQTPDPNQDKTPGFPNRSDDRGQSLSLAAAAAQIGDPAAIAFHNAVFTQTLFADSHSLIALNVRLNV